MSKIIIMMRLEMELTMIKRITPMMILLIVMG